jgi:hypothetical protein
MFSSLWIRARYLLGQRARLSVGTWEVCSWFSTYLSTGSLVMVLSCFRFILRDERLPGDVFLYLGVTDEDKLIIVG